MKEGQQGFRIWVDWNQDGVFDANEVVYQSSSYGGTHSGSFDVPVTALEGETRMRIVSHWLSTSANVSPCETGFTYGEFEDYTFEVIQLDDCSGMPMAGQIVGASTACLGVGFTMEIPGILESGITYVWGSSPSGLNTWTTIAGALSNAYTTSSGITEDTDYRVRVICQSSSLEDTTTVHTVTLNQPHECYCVPEGTNAARFINDFSTNGGVQNITNLGTGFSPGGYGDYSMNGVSQIINETINFTANTIGGSTGFRIWVDWNQNGVFDDNEVAYQSTSYAGSHSGSFVVPITALEGETRMRIVSHWGSSTANVSPCQTGFTNGEFEDYMFEVIPIPDCSTLTTPNAWTAVVDMDS